MVKEAYPDVKIIILTTFDDDDFVFSALKFGASGYLLNGRLEYYSKEGFTVKVTIPMKEGERYD